MVIFGEFNNTSADVTVSIWNADSHAAVVTNAVCTHTQNGLYMYNFSAADNAVDYYLVFTNNTDNEKVNGAIAKQKVVEIADEDKDRIRDRIWEKVV
jgi:hypothetical protein